MFPYFAYKKLLKLCKEILAFQYQIKYLQSKSNF